MLLNSYWVRKIVSFARQFRADTVSPTVDGTQKSRPTLDRLLLSCFLPLVNGFSNQSWARLNDIVSLGFLFHGTGPMTRSKMLDFKSRAPSKSCAFDSEPCGVTPESIIMYLYIWIKLKDMLCLTYQQHWMAQIYHKNILSKYLSTDWNCLENGKLSLFWYCIRESYPRDSKCLNCYPI